MDKSVNSSTDAHRGGSITLRQKAIEGGILFAFFLYLYKRVESYLVGTNESYYLISWVIYMVLFTTLFVLYNTYR